MNIIEYLEDKGIEYKTRGKNVSQGWIGINCPFCPDGDPSNHLGIHLQTGIISCWRCGAKGSIFKLVIKYGDSPHIISSKYFKSSIYTPPKRQFSQECELPSEAKDVLLYPHKKYLQKRGFSDPLFIFYRYNLKCCYLTGEWKHRLIIPVYMNNQLVTFTSRDVSDMSNLRYKTCPNEKSIIPIKECIYNYDFVYNKAIIVEGPIDAWKIGEGAVALFGKVATNKQINLLGKKLKEAYIMFDSDGTEEAEELGKQLGLLIPHVEIIELEKGDPAELEEREIFKLKREIFNEKFLE